MKKRIAPGAVPDPNPRYILSFELFIVLTDQYNLHYHLHNVVYFCRHSPIYLTTSSSRSWICSEPSRPLKLVQSPQLLHPSFPKFGAFLWQRCIMDNVLTFLLSGSSASRFVF
jgi:hypothetical protein